MNLGGMALHVVDSMSTVAHNSIKQAAYDFMMKERLKLRDNVLQQKIPHLFFFFQFLDAPFRLSLMPNFLIFHKNSF
jgi:hypothetical protein